MAADVHAIAVVADGARDAADALGRLEDDRTDIGAAEQFEGSGQAGWAGADNHSGLHAQGVNVSEGSAEIMGPGR